MPLDRPNVITLASPCPICEGSGQILVRGVDESEWTSAACLCCKGMGGPFRMVRP